MVFHSPLMYRSSASCCNAISLAVILRFQQRQHVGDPIKKIQIQRLIRITNKTIFLFYWGRISGPAAQPPVMKVHTFPARHRRGGAIRRNKNFFKVFYQETV